MEGEAKALLEVTTLIFSSLTYAWFASSNILPGKLRFLALLPVIVLLQFLPWRLSSVNLRAIIAFLFACYAPFKLLLLSFGLGTLSPSLALLTFIATSFLPIKLRSPKSPPTSPFLLLPSIVKLVLISLLASVFDYETTENHPSLLTCVCAFHFFLVLDFFLISAATFAALVLGLEVETQHVEPLKSDSLVDFWGRRWNLMVTSIMRPLIYLPIRARCGTASGFMVTFLVSGVIHDLMFYCITIERPTGVVTFFFVLHGLCTLAEVTARRKGWWRPKPAVARPMAIGFVVVTGIWLFVPVIFRGGAAGKSIEETAEVVRYLRMLAGQHLLPAGWVPLDDVVM